MKDLFSNRAFLIVMTSDILQNLGIWIRNMALLFFIVEKTNGDPVAVSILTILEYLPILIFSIVGGILADRWRPKRTMILGDILSFISIVLILIVVSSGVWQAAFLAVAVSAIVSQFSQPSSLKVIKSHVPEQQIQTAIAMSQTTMSLFIIIGPIIGTSIFQFLGIERSLMSLLVVFASSALILTFLPKTEISHQREENSFINDFKLGFKYVGQHKHLKVLFLMFAILGFGLGLIQPLDIFIVMERLGLDKENLQWFTALAGIGTLLGGVIAVIFSKRINSKLMIFLGLLFLGIATIIEVLSVWPMLTGTMRLITGIFMALIQTILATMLVTTVDKDFIGRINGLMTPTLTSSLLLGTLLTGFYLKETSLITVYLTAGSIFILTSIISFLLTTSAQQEQLINEKS